MTVPRFDELIHSPTRLAIVSLLSKTTSRNGTSSVCPAETPQARSYT